MFSQSCYRCFLHVKVVRSFELQVLFSPKLHHFLKLISLAVIVMHLIDLNAAFKNQYSLIIAMVFMLLNLLSALID